MSGKVFGKLVTEAHTSSSKEKYLELLASYAGRKDFQTGETDDDGIAAQTILKALSDKKVFMPVDNPEFKYEFDGDTAVIAPLQ